MNRAAIVIHIYKEGLEPSEAVSLIQLTSALANYPVFLVAPEGLQASAYRDILGAQLENIISFPRKYFSGLKGYNQLLLSKKYYEPFLNYEYILLHHTDAFVFRDELAFWMEKGYDDIGAPIYDYDGTMNPKNYVCSGNGGLSLRKVRTFYDIAGSMKVIYSLEDIRKDFRKYSWKGKIARSLYYLSLITTYGSRLNSQFNIIRENEDVIWGHHVPRYFKDFKVATFDEALRFSMEFNCDKLLEINDGNLPFGCHGWSRPLFIDFWKPYIEASTNKLLVL